MSSHKVLVVGQTPPPYGGQTIMIETLLRGNYGEGVTLYHISMRFSRNMGEIGRFKLSKFVELFRLLANVLYVRLFKGFTVLYYPPATSTWSGVLRDLVVLNLVRPFFRKVIFHFHAGGLGEFIKNNIPKLFWPLVRRAYFYPDIAIQLSELSPPDASFVHSRNILYIPYGVQDVYNTFSGLNSSKNSLLSCPIILFVGALYRSKGVFDILEAAKELKKEGYRFAVHLMGEGNLEVEDEIRNYIQEASLTNEVRLLGVLRGEDKWSAFANADIFCFPTYFESETFGVVLLEAMMFALPIVATFWRAIPTLVQDGKNGFLISIKNPKELAERLAVLIKKPELRHTMGQQGRKRFIEEYSLEKFWERMEQAFTMLKEV